MLEWRLFGGWSDEELVPRLEQARALRPNFSASPEEQTLEAGWCQVCSRTVVGRERPGPPEPGGLFERARWVLETGDFSDPRIVDWHFEPDSPLRGRTVLLELKVRALRYLCAVRVGDTRSEGDASRSIFGFSFETLEGHIEAGREWFLLTKEHASGEVRFRIEASWRPGQSPNWWSRLGFLLVGRRYQRAWHRLTHVRLRELTLQHPGLPPLKTGVLAHSGHDVGTGPVRVYARKGRGRRRARVEVEMERVTRGQWWTPVGLGVLAGMRSMSAPALVSRRLAREPGPPGSGLSRALSRRSVSRVLRVLALGELVADKLPWIPARVKPAPLVGRVLSGALVGATAAVGRHGARWGGAALGAVAALASSWAFYSLRRVATQRLRVPDTVVALAEDVAVAALSTRLMPALEWEALAT
jgi:uncharacterized membrane protein/uncharacterized protein (UPF0548 family)